jgi:hypothetical protein
LVIPLPHKAMKHLAAAGDWFDETEQRLEQRALPGAVGPQESHGPAPKLDSDIVQHSLFSEIDRDVFEIYDHWDLTFVTIGTIHP